MTQNRNTAKCKLCNQIIESYHSNDYCLCSCGEIYVDGGPFGMRCGARNWENFVRVDENGNEVIPKIVDPTDASIVADTTNGVKVGLTFDDALEQLKHLETVYKDLPQQVLYSSLSHSDMSSVLTLLVRVFDCLRASI